MGGPGQTGEDDEPNGMGQNGYVSTRRLLLVLVAPLLLVVLAFATTVLDVAASVASPAPRLHGKCRASNAALVKRAAASPSGSFPQWIPVTTAAGGFAGCTPLGIFAPSHDGAKTAIAYGINNPYPVFSPHHILVGYVIPKFGYVPLPDAVAHALISGALIQEPPAWDDFPPVNARAPQQSD